MGGREGERKGKEKWERKGTGGTVPLSKIPGYAPVIMVDGVGGLN